MDVDGYFYFWPANNGCWSAHIIHSIANKLDEVNKKWDDQIHEHFNSKPEPTEKELNSLFMDKQINPKMFDITDTIPHNV